MAITFLEMTPEIITVAFIIFFIVIGRCFLDPVDNGNGEYSEPFINSDDYKSLKKSLKKSVMI